MSTYFYPPRTHARTYATPAYKHTYITYQNKYTYVVVGEGEADGDLLDLLAEHIGFVQEENDRRVRKPLVIAHVREQLRMKYA